MAERRFRYNDGTVVTQGTDTPSTSTASDSLKNLSISMANQTPTSAITSSTLTPQPAFQIPQVAPSTSLAGELGALETRSSFNTEISKQRQDREKTAYDAYGKLFENMLGQKGETGLTMDAYGKEGGVDNIQVELDDINQQLLEEQESLRRRIETIQDNKEGMFRSGVEGEINRVQRESLRKQADLSVIQMGIQGRFDSAKAIADRAVQAQLEQQKQQNEALSLYASLNWDLFTKAEQREFEVAQGDREREYRKEEKALQEISDYSLAALQGGAPTSVVSQMRGAKTPEEAIRIGGQYVGAQDRLYKKLQIEQLQAEISNPTKDLTAGQYAALGFGERVVSASSIIDEIGDQFTGAGSLFGQFLPNTWKSADRQRFEQAQRNFINAVLRRESGAAISPTEFESAEKQYFPQVGDTAQVLLQKKMNRDLVAKALLREAGQSTAIQDVSLQDPLGLGITASTVNPLGI